MNTSQLIDSILSYLQDAKEQKARNLITSAGNNSLQDRFNCGAISAYNEIEQQIIQLAKTGE